MADPKGNFIVYQNRVRDPASNQPHFTGRISKPGAPHEQGIAVWLGKDKNGNLYVSGQVDAMPITDDVTAQLEAMTDRPVYDHEDVAQAGPNLTVRPRQLVGFVNKFKQPDATDTIDQAKKRAKQPDFWARVNPGDGSPVYAVGIWQAQDRYKRPLLRGETNFPKPGQPLDDIHFDMQADQRQVAQAFEPAGRNQDF